MSDNPSPFPGTPGPVSIPQRLALAQQLHGAGRLAEAEVLYRGVLQEDPRHPDALHLLGALAHQAGHHQSAIDLIRQAIAVQGDNAVYHNSLAVVCLATNRLDEAETHSRESVRLQPNQPDAHYSLAVALFGKGRLDGAESAFRETLRLRPGHVDAHCLLASVLRRQGRLAEAAPLLTEAVRLAPDHLSARVGLGGVLLDMSQPAAAEPHLREAVRLAPQFAAAHSSLGQALRDLNQTDEAAACFQEAIRLQPQHTTAHNNLGQLRESQGRPDEARAEFQEVLRTAPDDSWALAGLSRLAAAGHHAFRDDEVRRIEELAAQADRSTEERSRLHFALARLREKAGAMDDAFDHYRRANDLLKELLRGRRSAYDPAAHSRFIDHLIAVFTPAFFERVRPFGVESEVPVFVIGMPRSGTSLVEQIIASHPRARGAGEPRDLGELVTLLAHRLGGVETYPGCLERLDAVTARQMADAYLERLRRRGGAADRVVDKMPSNYQHVGLIAVLFPRAHIVHCRRDPVDTCLSCYCQEFAQPLPYGTDLGHLGHHYRERARLMAHWSRVLPLPMFDLNYEELTADQEAVSRRLIEFCGLEWDDRCLRFHETRRAVQTSSALQVRRPMYRSSVGRWKRYEKHLGPLLEALGNPSRARSGAE
jgi:tetratricopeptide (TPR) repeat protein